MVLEILETEDGNQITNSEQQHRLSPYAAVSRQWQYFFEGINFKRLILHQSDIPELDKMVQGQRRRFVKWIWLRLELPENDCNYCRKQESPRESREHNIIFTNALWGLFALLPTWKKDGEFGVGQRGLTLELSAHSPSDSMHFFKDLEGRINYNPWRKRKNVSKEYHDPAHGWENGQRTRKPRYNAKMRVFGPPSGIKFDLHSHSAIKMRTLPEVIVISSLVIRRQFYRAFSVPTALAPIIQCLTQLWDFIYEPWRGISTDGHCGQTIRDNEHEILFSDVFMRNSSLKMVSIFEDFNYCIHSRNERKPSTSLGDSLERNSRDLKELHASHNVDTKDFFHAFWPGQDPERNNGVQWENLTTLALTSLLLNYQDSDQLFQAAAAAAQRMPPLRIMELWNAREGDACIFRYDTRRERLRIHLLSTWGARLSAQARSCWENVAYGHSHHKLQVLRFHLDARDIKYPVSILKYLVLRSRLLLPASLKQMGVALKPVCMTGVDDG